MRQTTEYRERGARPAARAEAAEPLRAALAGAVDSSPVQATAAARATLWFLVAAISLAGTALVAYGGLTAGDLDWRALILLAALAALAERFDLSLYGDSRVSLAFVPIFASVLMAGVTGLAIVVPLALLASTVGTGRPFYKTAFNFGALMVAGAASVLVFDAFGSAGELGAWPQVMGVALLAAAANFAANGGLVAVAIAVSSGASLRSVWNEHFQWLWPHYLVLGVLGLAIASAYDVMGFWGVAVFLAPPVMMRLSVKQYLDRTTKSVLELRRANEDLQAAHGRVTDAMASLGKAYDGTLRSLVAALDARDRETRGHSERVAEITVAVAEEMGFQPGSEELRHIQWGALLHDVGKIAIADEILRKPSGFSDADWEAMRGHPDAGYDILRSVEFLAPAAEIVRAHHEHYDGSGYPRGLAGDEIPLGARIFAPADAFDAMTSHRPYRRALPPEEALAELLRNSGTQFDPAVVRAFLSVYQRRFLKAVHPGSPQPHLSNALKQAILEAVGMESAP